MGLHFSPKQKWLNEYQTACFPVMEWSTDTNNGYDDLEIYMEIYSIKMSVSSTGKNHAMMAPSLFNLKSPTTSIVSIISRLMYENVVYIQ